MAWYFAAMTGLRSRSGVTARQAPARSPGRPRREIRRRAGRSRAGKGGHACPRPWCPFGDVCQAMLRQAVAPGAEFIFSDAEVAGLEPDMLAHLRAPEVRSALLR
jgi:glycine/D-amino acid oxidase-like deaminating enzyme